MKQVVILQGIPGSGKTTLAKKLIAEAGEGVHAIVVSADHYFERLGGGAYRFVAERLGEAHQDCYRRFLSSVVEDVNLVIVDNCDIEAVCISPYVMLAEALGYKVKIIRVECDPEVASRRNIHNVPPEGVRKIAEQFKEEQRHYPQWWTFETVRTDGEVKI